MATIWLNPGGDETFNFDHWTTTANTPTIVNDIVHGAHIKSIKFAPNTSQQAEKDAVLADAGSRVSFYLYLNTLPSGSGGGGLTVPVLLNNSANSNTVFALNITSAGVLQFVDNNGTQLGTNGATLTTGVWNRICISYTVTSTTVNTLKLFVNGTISITVTNGTLTGTGSANIIFGNNNGDSTMDIRLSDIYIDNSSALTDTGDIWVTAKRPFSNGTTNGFTTQVGSGGSGYGTGHAPQVNERISTTTNGWSVIGAGSAITEEYNIEGESVGDIDIANATKVDYMGWLTTKALIAETGKIIINNVQTSVSIGTGYAVLTVIAGSSTYPAGTGTDIGEITSTTVTTVTLAECGIIFAFIPVTLRTNAKRAMLGVGL